MAVTPEVGAMDEAGAIVTIQVTLQVPMSALLLLSLMSRNKMPTSPKAHQVNANDVMDMVLAKELMEANKAAES